MAIGSNDQSFRAQYQPLATSSDSEPLSSANHLPQYGASDTNVFKTALNKIRTWNPFSPDNRPLRLPLTEDDVPAETESENVQPVQEPSWFTLSTWDRLLIFGICLLGALACFILCFAIFPVLLLKARKFALLWSLGSVLVLVAFAVLQGPLNYLAHLISPKRLPFTVVYVTSFILTLVFTLAVKSVILALIACIIQVLAAGWYTISYFPMGAQSLRMVTRVGTTQVNSWIDS